MQAGASQVPVDREVLRRLAAEVGFALRDLEWRDWAAIGGDSAGAAVRDTVAHKERLYRDGKELVSRTVARYQGLGFKRAAKADLEAAGRLVDSLPGRAQACMEQFSSLPDDRRVEEVAAWILTMGLTYAIAGGGDVEGGLPDKDIALLGIGSHRSVLTHSVLLGLGAEFAMRFSAEAVLRMHPRLPENHHLFWDRAADFVRRNRGMAVGAVWSGIGMHLMKDASLLASATKPVVGLPLSVPMGLHQAFLAANAAVASVVGLHATLEPGEDKEGRPAAR